MITRNEVTIGGGGSGGGIAAFIIKLLILPCPRG